jgi:hypothetical protein
MNAHTQLLGYSNVMRIRAVVHVTGNLLIICM